MMASITARKAQLLGDAPGMFPPGISKSPRSGMDRWGSPPCTLLNLLSPKYRANKSLLTPWGLPAVSHAGTILPHPNSLVRFDRTGVVDSTIHHIILPCHHCNLYIFCHLFCLLAHIIMLFSVLGTTVQHLHDLLSPYLWSPSPTNVLNSSFVCWHLAQHMLTSHSYCSRLCTFTVTISYSQ